jgi:hypothetical protein
LLHVLSPLGEEQSPSFKNKLKSPPPRMICAKFGKNWSKDSGEEFKNVEV